MGLVSVAIGGLIVGAALAGETEEVPHNADFVAATRPQDNGRGTVARCQPLLCFIKPPRRIDA